MNKISNLRKLNFENPIQNRGKKEKKPSKFKLKLCKDNTIKSLYEVEHFLNNFNNIFKYIKLYKILK